MAYDQSVSAGSQCTMTMLDRMRRHRNWLKWSLGLVCLAFVIFYIPDFLQRHRRRRRRERHGRRRRGPRDHAADEFRRTYQAQLQAYRSAYGAQHERAAAEAARHRPADPAADGRRARGARRGRAPRHHASATRKSRSASSRFPRSRRTARSSASSATSSCSRMQRPPLTPSRVRGQRPPHRSSSRSCARRSPSGCRSPTRSSSRSTAAATTR